MDIHLGLNNYRRLRYMNTMAKLLKHKKKQERLLALNKDESQHLKYLKEITKINR